MVSSVRRTPDGIWAGAPPISYRGDRRRPRRCADPAPRPALHSMHVWMHRRSRSCRWRTAEATGPARGARHAQARPRERTQKTDPFTPRTDPTSGLATCAPRARPADREAGSPRRLPGSCEPAPAGSGIARSRPESREPRAADIDRGRALRFVRRPLEVRRAVDLPASFLPRTIWRQGRLQEARSCLAGTFAADGVP